MSKLTSEMTGLTPDTPFTNDIERAQTLYFNWLCNMVHADNYFNRSWFILAKLLHNMEYYWTIPNDDNRGTDGIKLRQTWLDLMENEAEDLGIGHPMFPLDSLNGPCTLLEMLVGLAVRIESDIMQNPEKGNRTAVWFWCMVENVLNKLNYLRWGLWESEGMNPYSDNQIDTIHGEEVKEKFTKMMDRDYEEDGVGGLFPLNNPKEDQQGVELWYQAQAWLEENYPDEFY